MKNNNIKQIILITVVGLFLSACGGGGSSSSSSVATLKVPQCGTSSDKGRAIAENVTGKIIKKVEEGAEVRIWYTSDSTKLGCMITGKAIIVDN